VVFSPKALRLITEFEGINQPGQWPGHKSGITLGYGYDLGYVTVDEFEADWEGCFAPVELERLKQAVGRIGSAAAALAPTLADIRCNSADATHVLLARSIPAGAERARRTFPGFDALPLDAQGALVSLVLNRGSSMTDGPGTDDRREMRAIRDLVPQANLAGIATELRSMQRLWIGKKLDGLLARREAEAALVESCIAPPRPRRATSSRGKRRSAKKRTARRSKTPRRE
jgi:GH24 family phage-related lysozyme (muramidase)